jgi:excinuclease UvrABC nuclease subunit
MDAALALANLSAARCPLAILDAPSAPGVYAFFLRERGVLPGVDELADSIVYIGLSSNLAQREFDSHFRAGQSGFSTLRRT